MTPERRKFVKQKLSPKTCAVPTAIPSLLALDFLRLTARQREAALDCYSNLQDCSLKPFCYADTDSTRSQIDRFICSLTRLNFSKLEKLKDLIVQEPIVNAGIR